MNPTAPARVVVLAAAIATASFSARAAAPAGAKSPSPAASEATAAAAPTHTLFMGVDLAVQREDQVLPVRDVQGAALIVKARGKDVEIPTRGKPLNMKVNRSLKVSSRTATFDKVSFERGYTPANDPNRKFRAAAGAVGGQEAVASIEQVDYAAATLNLDRAQVWLNTGGGGDMESAQRNVDVATEQLASQTSAMLNSYQAADSPTLSTGVHANIMQGELAEGAFDALDITFMVSSPEPIEQAYVVLLAELKSGEATKAQVHNWVYAKSIGRVDATPQRVYVKQGGFPLGFTIEEYQIHLYNQGEEIATNIAPMRVELSREEAFEYANVDFVTKNKQATLPADLAFGQDTLALTQHLLATYRGGPVYVRVAPTGKINGIFRDKACSDAIEDAALEAILSDLRFTPALAKGKPVESVAIVKAAEEGV